MDKRLFGNLKASLKEFKDLDADTKPKVRRRDQAYFLIFRGWTGIHGHFSTRAKADAFALPGDLLIAMDIVQWDIKNPQKLGRIVHFYT